MMNSVRAPRSHSPSRRLARDAGQAFVIVAMLLPVLLGAMGLAVDLSMGFASRRLAQNTADAAAFGGAILVGDNNQGITPFTSGDIVNAFKDAVNSSSAPQTVNLVDPSGTCSAATTMPKNTLGTVDIVAQYVDAAGASVTASNGTSYLCSGTTPIPTNAKGVRAMVSWPQTTYFGRALRWDQYTVAGTAAYLVKATQPTQASLAPFAVWWDPPYGPCQAQQLQASVNLNCTNYAPGSSTTPPVGFPFTPSQICGAPAAALPCLANTSPNTDPLLDAPYGPPVGTQVVFFSNGWASDAGASNGALNPNTDPDYQLGANDFKGYFGWTGAQLTCTDSYIGVNGNGSNGQNAQAALQMALTMLPGSTRYGVALFAAADKGIKSGSVYIHSYGAIPLLVDMQQVNNAGSNGPWIGTVINFYIPGSNSSCSTTPPTGSYIVQPSALQ